MTTIEIENLKNSLTEQCKKAEQCVSYFSGKCKRDGYPPFDCMQCKSFKKKEKIMKMFMFRLTKTNSRTGEQIGMMVGVVQAENYEAASDKAWEKYGSDASYGFDMWDITAEDGESIMQAFTVYKSEI